MNLSFLVVSNDNNNQNQRRLVEEFLKKKLKVKVVPYSKIRIFYRGKVEILVEGKDIRRYRGIIFRGPIDWNQPEMNYQYLFEAVVRYVKGQNIKILNGGLFVNYPDLSNKLVQMVELASIGLPLVETEYLADQEGLLSAIKGWPRVFKTVRGSQGEGVKKIISMNEGRKWIEEFGVKRTMVQRLLDTREDYRLMVLRNRVLGTMRRRATTKSGFVTNATVGGKCDAVDTPQMFKTFALKAAKHFKADILGVDVMCDQTGNPYILEINKTPGFVAFEKAVGINVAGLIVEYMMSES